jgi:hypothetical protein
MWAVTYIGKQVYAPPYTPFCTTLLCSLWFGRVHGLHGNSRAIDEVSTQHPYRENYLYSKMKFTLSHIGKQVYAPPYTPFCTTLLCSLWFGRVHGLHGNSRAIDEVSTQQKTTYTAKWSSHSLCHSVWAVIIISFLVVWVTLHSPCICTS